MTPQPEFAEPEFYAGDFGGPAKGGGDADSHYDDYSADLTALFGFGEEVEEAAAVTAAGEQQLSSPGGGGEGDSWPPRR